MRLPIDNEAEHKDGDDRQGAVRARYGRFSMDETVAVIRRMYDAFNTRNVEAMSELWTTDAEWRPALLVGGMEGAVHRGREGLAEFVELQADTWASVVADPLEMRELGDRVLVTVRIKAVGRTSDIPFELVTWTVFELRGGQIAAGRVFTDEDEALAAWRAERPIG